MSSRIELGSQKKKLERLVLPIGSEVLQGRLKIKKHLSVGRGMANVYLVEDNTLHKDWVLKQILQPEFFKNSIKGSDYSKLVNEYDALIREARVMQSLEHPGIPRITSLENDPYTKSVFIQMDYINGKDASHFIAKFGTVEEERAVMWINGLCNIIAYLHNLPNPIVYRDSKPNNMMISANGNVNLIDFGTAEVITETHRYPTKALGTPGYASPEQKKKSNPLTPQSDIFAIGATLYHFLSGVAPGYSIPVKDEGGNVVKDSSGRIKTERINPVDGPYDLHRVAPHASPGLRIVIEKCTQPRLEDRYQNIEEVIEALATYKTLDNESRRVMRRKVNTVTALGIAGILLCTGSLIPFYANKNYAETQYQNSVLAADKSGNVEDYVKAIDQRPDDLKPYFGMLEAIQQDGTFSKEEESDLLGLLNPNLTEIKAQPDYPELAFKIGKLYWFYYATTDDITSREGRTQATKWFEDAVNGGYKGENNLAETYYSIGSFDQSISGKVKEAEDGGMYKKYWVSLTHAQSESSGEIVDLQIMIALADAINNYGYRLKTDGVPEDDVLAQVDKINNYLNTAQVSEGSPKVLYSRLKESSNGLRDKVELAYAETAQKAK